MKKSKKAKEKQPKIPKTSVFAIKCVGSPNQSIQSISMCAHIAY